MNICKIYKDKLRLKKIFFDYKKRILILRGYFTDYINNSVFINIAILFYSIINYIRIRFLTRN